MLVTFRVPPLATVTVPGPSSSPFFQVVVPVSERAPAPEMIPPARVKGALTTVVVAVGSCQVPDVNWTVPGPANVTEVRL